MPRGTFGAVGGSAAGSIATMTSRTSRAPPASAISRRAGTARASTVSLPGAA